MFGLEPPQLKRTVNNLMFLFELVNGFIDCPAVLQDIDITVPRGKRSRSVYHRCFRPTNHSLNSGVSRLFRSGGAVALRVNFFHDSPASFRRSICGTPPMGSAPVGLIYGALAVILPYF